MVSYGGMSDGWPQESGTDYKEMYKVFNMGHRMEVRGVSNCVYRIPWVYCV